MRNEIGKGRGNRVFDHALGLLESGPVDDEGLDPKVGRVNAILAAGLVPSHVVHRHGLDELTAFEVEAALMDAYPGLTNVQGGHGSAERGAMHVEEIIAIYRQRVADFGDVPLLVIKVSRSLEERSLYDATRAAWRLDPGRAAGATYVLAASVGKVLEVYRPDRWLSVDDPEFEHLGFEPGSGRHGFVGRVADAEVRARWVSTRLPPELMRQGAASPVRYVNC